MKNLKEFLNQKGAIYFAIQIMFAIFFIVLAPEKTVMDVGVKEYYNTYFTWAYTINGVIFSIMSFITIIVVKQKWFNSPIIKVKNQKSGISL